MKGSEGEQPATGLPGPWNRPANARRGRTGRSFRAHLGHRNDHRLRLARDPHGKHPEPRGKQRRDPERRRRREMLERRAGPHRADHSGDPAEGLLHAHRLADLLAVGDPRDERGGRREEQRGADGDQHHHHAEERNARCERHQREAEGEREDPELQDPRLAEARHRRTEHEAPHHQRDGADEGVEVADRLLGDAEAVLQVERQHGVHRHERHHAEGIDPDERGRRPPRMGEHRAHHPADRALRRRFSLAYRALRLGQVEEAEGDVGDTEPRRHQPRRRRAERRGERTDRRADHHAGRRRRSQPAERLGTLLGRHRIADVGLHHPRRPGACPLHQARDEEHGEQDARRQRVGRPLGAGERKEQVGERRDGEAAEDRRPSPDAVREATPERCGRELRDGERRDHQPHDHRVGTEPRRVERQERQDHQEAEHVHEAGGHEERQAPERRTLIHPPLPCSCPKSRKATAEAAASSTP